MKNLLLLAIVLLMFSCANETAKETNTKESTLIEAVSETNATFKKTFDDFMIIEEGKLFRGLNFNLTMSEVRKIERVRAAAQEKSSEKMDELFFEVDLTKEILDFANVKYSFAADGLYFISAEGFFINEKMSLSFFQQLKSFFEMQYGKGDLAEDGYLEFETKVDKKEILIAIKEVNVPPTTDEKGGYGFFLVYSLMN